MLGVLWSSHIGTHVYMMVTLTCQNIIFYQNCNEYLYSFHIYYDYFHEETSNGIKKWLFLFAQKAFEIAEIKILQKFSAKDCICGSCFK